MVHNTLGNSSRNLLIKNIQLAYHIAVACMFVLLLFVYVQMKTQRKIPAKFYREMLTLTSSINQ